MLGNTQSEYTCRCVSPGAPAKPWTGIMLPSAPLGSLDEVILPGGPASPVSITGGCGKEASKGPTGTVTLLREPWGSPPSLAATWTPDRDREGGERRGWHCSLQPGAAPWFCNWGQVQGRKCEEGVKLKQSYSWRNSVLTSVLWCLQGDQDYSDRLTDRYKMGRFLTKRKNRQHSLSNHVSLIWNMRMNSITGEIYVFHVQILQDLGKFILWFPFAHSLVFICLSNHECSATKVSLLSFNNTLSYQPTTPPTLLYCKPRGVSLN